MWSSVVNVSDLCLSGFSFIYLFNKQLLQHYSGDAAVSKMDKNPFHLGTHVLEGEMGDKQDKKYIMF